mgnify:CR=1 FL=1
MSSGGRADGAGSGAVGTGAAGAGLEGGMDIVVLCFGVDFVIVGWKIEVKRDLFEKFKYKIKPTTTSTKIII